MTEPNEPSSELLALRERLAESALEQERLGHSVYTLTELLISKGIIGLRELEDRKRHAAEQMIESSLSRFVPAERLIDESDKYSAAPLGIDCDARAHLCKAACCRMRFVLGKQDLEEGVVRFDVEHPFQIRQRADGWCAHCDSKTKRCDVHAQRPLVCRRYDCRNDARIWQDFERAIPNPELADL